MVSHNTELVEDWKWLMDDTASYTVGGGRVYRDGLDLIIATMIEKGVDPYDDDIDAETQAHINKVAREIVDTTIDIYALDDEIQAEGE